MSKVAWVFPGQGSQAVGMGVDLQETEIGQSRLEQAEAILGWSVLERTQGEKAALAQTVNTQPCLFVVEAILADLLVQRGHLPALVAGHSLGEYVALYTARVFDFEAGLRLVKRRSELMSQATGGKMVAMMKFDRSQLTAALAAQKDVVLANDNSQQQVVISGTPAAVDRAIAQIKAKRVIPLEVSGAFHSHLMAEAADQFETLLGDVEFNPAKVPVLSNTEPTPTTDPNELKARLIRQMTGSVRWQEIMLQLQTEGATDVYEVGPGKVLNGLIKRTCRQMNLKNISTLADLPVN